MSGWWGIFAALFVMGMLNLAIHVVKDNHCSLEKRVAAIDHQPLEKWCTE